MSTSKATGDVSDIDITEILARIPHRYPFLLVDRCESFVPNTSIVGIKCVTYNEPFFQGHFPGHPVMPGVLIVEALGQTGAIMMSKSMDIDISNMVIYFMTIDGVRFRAPVRPGDVLHMHVEVTKVRGDIFKFRGKALVNGKVCAEAEFAAMKALAG
ncbi:3-hydroxyacyl-ACP dehydratase FabZ [Caulobacter sp. NIBR1757]|uniref:3-hydroxyacyl-ACP dehydratase FabZ n=1 Tax=Caulobacter sp. NIBR1757 TaxID=3016000 RepID=UPI0022F04A23|nr:3-hydroxyacyl-ACP dehydratase FabZ [Caulobacter sp. NIBR1757]WGM38781.1 3-hydroxyacyl-[acyl-carrier-protein] dehydratase FabZ [Caulobacter sp. NIBR1757]